MVHAQVQTGLLLNWFSFSLTILARVCNKRKFQKRKPIIPAKGGQTAMVVKCCLMSSDVS